MFAAFGVGEVLWSMFWFFLIFMWIMLLFNVFADLFRSKDLSGVAKVIWIVVLVLLPYLGVFVYLIARGASMAERQLSDAKAQDAAMRDYIQASAGTGPATELARLAELREQGHIDDAEFAAAKAKILG